MRRSSLVRNICHKILSSRRADLWKQLRHLLGRLSSWLRAAKHLVLVCKRFPDYVRNFRLQTLENPKLPVLDFHTRWRSISDVVQEVIPRYDGDLLQNALIENQSSELIDVVNKAVQNMTEGRFRPRVHAEILLSEHFHSMGLPFYEGDRYIGCSKPSCYCCDLYLRYHPGGFAARPSHGNVWTKWAPPLQQPVHEPIMREVLDRMLMYIKADLISQIMSSHRIETRRPDSTTGLATTESYLTI